MDPQFNSATLDATQFKINEHDNTVDAANEYKCALLMDEYCIVP